MTIRFTRRRLLASTTLATVGALPFARHLTPVSYAATAPQFLFVLYHPFGVVAPEWYPDDFGRDFTFKMCSEPLEEIRDDVILIQNIDNAMGEKNECENGWDQHAAGVCSIFSGATMMAEQESGGPTVDTLVGKHFHPELHHDDVVANLGVRSDEHKTAKNILKKSDGAVIVSQDDPSKAFASILSGVKDGPAPPQGDDARAPFTGLKDALKDDINLFEASLAAPERERFQSFMDSFDSYEKGLGAAPTAPVGACAVPDENTLLGGLDHRQADLRPIAKAQTKLGALAMSCGARRVVTLQLTGGFTGFLVPPGPYPDSETVHGHHLSHGTQGKGDDKKLRVNLNWQQANQFVDVVKELKASANPFTGGPLFDDSVVVWASGLSGIGGGGHSKLRVPATIAAGKNTGYVTGRHLDANYATNSMLLRSVCTSFGMPDQPFGDVEFSSEPLGGLFEDTAVAGNYDRNVLDYYGTGKYPRCANHKK